ncbi:hypothetical protein Tco_0057610 [Tanacetum coccineum]
MVFTSNTSLDVTFDEMFDEMSMNEFLKRKYIVDEYYDAFNSSFSNKGLDGLYLIDLFVFGLQPEIEKTVKIDEKKFVENGFKLNKIDESQVGVLCLEDSIMDFDKVCEEAMKSSELELNVSCKVDVDGDGRIVKKMVSKEGDKDEEMSSKYLSGVEDNNTYNKEDYGVKCNEEVRNLVNGIAGMQIDSGRNGDSNFDVMGVDDVIINLSKEDANRDSHKEVKNIKECGGKG